MGNYYEIEAWSSSKLRAIKNDFRNLEVKFEQTASTMLGTAIHSYVLEGKRDFTISKYKTLCKSFENEDLLEGQIDTVFAVGEAIKKHPLSNLLSGEVEKEYFWKMYGKDFKAKIDLVGEAIVDIKTIHNISDAYKRIKYDYYIQSWLYKRAVEMVDLEVKNFYYCFAQTSYPYTVEFWKVENDNYAEDEVIKLLEAYDNFKLNNINLNDVLKVF